MAWPWSQSFCYVPMPAWSFFGHEVILGAAICDTLCTFFDISRITTEKGNNRANRGNLDLEIFKKKSEKNCQESCLTDPDNFSFFFANIHLDNISTFFFKISLHFSWPSYASWLSWLSITCIICITSITCIIWFSGNPKNIGLKSHRPWLENYK